MNNMYMAIRDTDDKATYFWQKYRNLHASWCVKGAVIELFFAESAKKNNKFSHNSADEISA